MIQARGRLGKGMGVFANNKGFTLIEMAIVLIIIGIIIGAVVKGKDLVRSAEMKQLYSKYMATWKLAYDAYYDRTGWVLGDTNTAGNTGARDGHCDPATTEANLVSQLQRVGLEPPPQGPTGSRLVRTYTDSTGRHNTLTIALDYRSAQGNYIRIAGVPNELGIATDRMVDGENDGATGDFLYVANYTQANWSPAPWPSAQTAPTANAAAVLKLSF